jgi:predicted DNA-binding transcriptional regulator YafY
LKTEEVINGLETAERRIAILKLICRRRFETIANLAYEFDVSERTIRRDIEFLMRTEPIYTQPGRYGGGVYAMDTYTMDRMYFREDELNVVLKLFESAEKKEVCELNSNEKRVLEKLINDYKKPSKKEKR